MAQEFYGSTQHWLHDIVKSLTELGLRVQTDVPYRTAGVRLDALAETPGGQRIVIEVKVYHYTLNARRIFDSLLEHLERYRRITGSSYAFLVMPNLPSEGGRYANLVTPKGLVDAIQAILAAEQQAVQPPLFEKTDSLPLIEEVPTLFVAMPFAPEFEDTYAVAMVGAAKETGFVCDRIDFDYFDDLILSEMHDRIRRCVGIVADLTNANPNVMYELGYAKGLHKPAVLISVTEPALLPFDVRSWQIMKYEFGRTARLEKELAEVFRKRFSKSAP